MDIGIKKIGLSSGIIAFFLVLAALCLFSQYPLLALYGMFTLFIIIRSTWTRYQPTVIFFWFVYQWVQVMAGIWYADIIGDRFEIVFRNNSVEKTILICFTGILLQVFVVKAVLSKQKLYTLDQLKAAAFKINVNRLIILYVVSAALYPLLFKVAINFGEVTQVILTITKLKMLFTIMLVILLFIRGEKKMLILLILLFEFITGFLTYFSSFKDVIIICLICYLSFIRQVKLGTILKLSPLLILLFTLLVFWSAVKPKYRTYVNEGTRAQQVQVESSDALKKILDLASTFNGKEFQKGLYSLAHRVQYVFFLSKVVDRIPEMTPYENGELMVNSLRFVIVPRFLDPDKGIHDASVKTSKYTGYRIAGMSKGTSMAIGYYGDAYIDFGPVGMMIPIIIIVILVGLYYRFLMSIKINLIMVYAITMTFVYNIGYFESDIIVILGNMKNGFIMNLVLIYTLYPVISRYLTSGKIRNQNVYEMNKKPLPSTL